MVLDGAGKLCWMNEAATSLVPTGTLCLTDAIGEEDAEILRAAAAGGVPLAVPLRLTAPRDASTVLATLQPLDSGRAVVTLLPAQGEATPSGLAGRTTFMRRLERSL